MLLTTVEILARCSDLQVAAFRVPAHEHEIAVRRRGGLSFLDVHRLVRDAGGTDKVTAALQAATPTDQAAADARVTPEQWAQIIQLVMLIMAQIAANKPTPVPAP